MHNLERANQDLQECAAMFQKTATEQKTQRLYCGVDLGTASIIMVVVNEAGQTVACEMQACQVAKDGLVVDYMGAVKITQSLHEKLQQRLGCELPYAAIAVPPGTESANSATHCYVVEACGMEVLNTLDEPSAANAVLGIQNGVVVDIGGGTTGLSVFENGKVVYVADEATGGTHISLVLMGRNKMDYEQAEAFKQDSKNHDEVRVAVLPVMEKMAGIVKRHIEPFVVNEVCLVGGTCSLRGIEDVFTRVLQVPAYKPQHPMMVTPLGIALSAIGQDR